MSLEYRKIMVTLDGSSFAAAALPHAEKLARTFGSELILFRVAQAEDTILDSPAINPLGQLRNVSERVDAAEAPLNAVDLAERELEHQAEHLRLHDIQANWVVESGDPAECIVGYAQRHDIDLLLICSHGRKGVARALLGSVAQEILTEVHCPVLIIKPEA